MQEWGQTPRMGSDTINGPAPLWVLAPDEENTKNLHYAAAHAIRSGVVFVTHEFARH